MSLQYPGGTIVMDSYAQTTGTRAELITQIINDMITAGWANFSGSGTDQTLVSQANSNANKIYVRCWDPGSGSCCRMRIRNNAATLVSQDYFLLPATLTAWRI